MRYQSKQVRKLKDELRKERRASSQARKEHARNNNKSRLDVAGAKAELEADNPSAAPGPAMCHMLVVEDDPFQAESILILCNQCGYQVQVVSSASEVRVSLCGEQASVSIQRIHARPTSVILRRAHEHFRLRLRNRCPFTLNARRWTSSRRTPRSTLCCPMS